MGLKERAKRLMAELPALSLAIKKKRTPIAAKICALTALAYALSPIDLIPDFIPVLGYLDEVLILPALIALTVKLIPKATLAACRKQAEQTSKKNRQERWYFAIPILIIWILLLWLVLHALGVL